MGDRLARTGEALLSPLDLSSGCVVVDAGSKVTLLGVCDKSKSSNLVKLPDLLILGSLLSSPLLPLIDGSPLVVSGLR